MEQLLPYKILKWGKQEFYHEVQARKIHPRPTQFSLRLFKPDRLLVWLFSRV
ncbi:hypothetical protein NTGM5_30093 [Candidatus Nitrotoga sp. M5]|nr:hypothetical protein NTGM5_30093 [Candidatus Nitrotoga sp. M5]